ncbi:DUF4399 domain-containing protein [Algiphilus sp. W345]|uniref:DUF4399 domain-containing protein n=1 Tax=Banduia mediterranea TaxID=3075609 RepID=A0ABU2WGD0_9GAMM|nr:DUF4399 domain-containing protein [Algiphilus sp. W345]MDT0496694.1 DUF4399 domain-containing protein [Algiphilus sp. W345]
MRLAYAAVPLFVLTLAAGCNQEPADSAEDMKAMTPAEPAAHEMTTEPAMSAPAPVPDDARVYFVEPTDGATVSSPVKILFGAEHVKIVPAGDPLPNSGHHHLLIDDPEIDTDRPLPATDQVVHFGKAQTETEIELTPGEHTLQLILGDWKHQPTDPVVKSDTITITVSEGDAVE